MALKTGPKKSVSVAPLCFSGDGLPSERFRQFCAEFLVIPKGIGVGDPLILNPWQVELMASVMDPVPRPSIAGFMLPRGQAKTTIMSAWMIFELYLGVEGNQLVCVAVDERQARLLFETAAAMVSLNPELSSRCEVFRDSLRVPGRRSTFTALPAEAKRLEGLGNFSLAVADEIGVIARDTWQTLLLGLGKVENATVVGIGTPSVAADSVLLDLRQYGQDRPDDPTFVWREYSADEFTATHPVDCRHCWYLANPAMDPAMGEPFLSEASMTALLPPKTREGAFRRARLCQFVPENENPFIPKDVWDGLGTGEGIPPGTRCVLAVDGAFGGANADTFALVLATVSPTPHFMPLRVWETDGTPTFRVNLAEVEDEIRAACKTWKIAEVVIDPFRLNRSAQTLSSEGITVTEFSWSPSRVTKATVDLYGAAVNGQMSHSSDKKMTEHVMNATVTETDGGLKLSKTSRSRNAGKIDLCAAMLMGHSRATWLSSHTQKKYRTVTFK